MDRKSKTVLGLFLLWIIFPLFTLKSSKTILARERTSESSAALVKRIKYKDKRVERLKLFLKSYNSPLSSLAEEFISQADKNGIDWRLLPAIAGVESSFGKHTPHRSYNAYGWNNGNFYFKTWEEGIEIVSSSLKKNYYDRGADTVFKIAPIYAPPTKTWALKVSYFMEKIENFPLLSSSDIKISL